tara:strand:+ start:3122 stop:4189 length:1068 start_codon:yes stop_codon:yes gene_type:complete
MKLDKKHKKSPYIIAGPCSAESESQILETARLIKDNIDIYRAGIWKPRTNPGSFEGVGKRGLQWLKKVQQELNVKVATEVATPKHVELCLNSGIDALWIGARTTVNPFYVQEIAEALNGVDIPIFVKNPIHPDIALWIGAIDRLNKNGIKKITAVHRGFFTYELSAYRNEPKWEIPIDLKSRMPELPIICDPSHITGNRNMILEVAQTSMDLDMDGLMIETHIFPDLALSDSKQQINPEKLRMILNSLIYRNRDNNNTSLNKELAGLRKSIDRVDSKIVKLLSERTDLVKDIAISKLEYELTIFQLNRWFEILTTRKNLAKKLSVDPKMISDIYELIHKYSILTQSQLMKKEHEE